MSEELPAGVSPGTAPAAVAAARVAGSGIAETGIAGAGIPAAVPERRRDPRFECDGNALILLPHGGLSYCGSILNISDSGCYIQARSINLERGTQVEVYFETRQLAFRVAGNITVLHLRTGAGIAFLHLSPRSSRQILDLVKELAEHA